MKTRFPNAMILAFLVAISVGVMVASTMSVKGLDAVVSDLVYHTALFVGGIGALLGFVGGFAAGRESAKKPQQS